MLKTISRIFKMKVIACRCREGRRADGSTCQTCAGSGVVFKLGD